MRLFALLVVGLALAGVTAPAAPLDPELAAAIAGIQQARITNQLPQALKACDDALAKFKDPAQAKYIRLARLDVQLAMKKGDEVIAEAGKLQQEFPQDKDVIARAQLAAAEALRVGGKLPDAVAAYQKLAANPLVAAEAQLRAGDVLAVDLKKPAEALAAYTESEKASTAETLVIGAAAAGKAAGLAEAANDLPKATAFYHMLNEKYLATVTDENARAQNFAKEADCLVKAGKTDEAVAALARGEKALEKNLFKAQMVFRGADAPFAAKKYPECRAECDRLILSYPLETDMCQAAQTRIVETYRLEAKFEEALGAARILYDGSGSDAGIKAAAAVTAQMFRAMDGNLARANEFLAYQRFGPNGPDGKPGTPDDLAKNHLADVKYPPADAARDKKFADALAAQPSNYDGFRAKGYLCIYAGKPKEAAMMFRQAFRCAPELQVQAAATEMVLVGLKAHRACFAGLDQAFEFISYGPKGKSGQANLADPFAGMQ